MARVRVAVYRYPEFVNTLMSVFSRYPGEELEPGAAVWILIRALSEEEARVNILVGEHEYLVVAALPRYEDTDYYAIYFNEIDGHIRVKAIE